MKPQKTREYKLNMATLNGIIIAIIGILVLLTPVFIELPKEDLRADLLAGGLLIVGGGATVAWGLLRKQQIEVDDSTDKQESA